MRSCALVARAGRPTSRSSTSQRRSPTGSRSSCRRAAAPGATGGAATGQRGEGEPRQRHARAARRFARHRAGDGAEDPRLAPDALTAAFGRRPRRDPRHRAGPRRAAARPGDAVSRLQEGHSIGVGRRSRSRPSRSGLPPRTGSPSLVLLGIAASAAAVGSGVPPAAEAPARPRGDRARRPRVLVGRPAAARARPQRPRDACRRSRRCDGRRHGCCQRLALRGSRAGRRAALRRGRTPRAGAARAPCRPGASAGCGARSPGAPRRPARARDRLRRARMARAAWDPCRPACERPLACRRPAGRDRWRGRSAAHGNWQRPVARDDRRAPVAPDRRRARRRPGHRSGSPRRLQGVGALPPTRSLGAEHRPDRLRRARADVRRGAGARRRSHTRDRGDPRNALAVGWQPSVVPPLPPPPPPPPPPAEPPVAPMAMGAVVLLAWTPRARCSSPASSSRSQRWARSSSRCRVCAGCTRAIRCLLRSSRSSVSLPPAGS